MLERTKHYMEVTVSKWDKLIKFEEEHKPSHEKQWIFKGVKDSGYHLFTTLERDVANIQGIDPNKNKRELRKLLKKGIRNEGFKKYVPITKIESGLIRRFQRQCHHFNIETPDRDNILEWLALMRHYRAPTRLLDWTYSFYVALFFALSDAKPGTACAVWALETKSLEKRMKEQKAAVFTRLRRDEHVTCKTWKEVFSTRKANTFVYPVNPFKLNERLVIQQGAFLCPGNVGKTFEDNLAEVLPEYTNKDKNKRKLVKCTIECEPKERNKILLNLHRMNINRATLFPGLGGFAQSLKTLIVYPNLIKAVPKQPC